MTTPPTWARVSPGGRLSWYLNATLLTVLMATLSSCLLIRRTLELPDQAVQAILPAGRGGKGVDPVELQAELIRFSDNFLLAVNSTLDEVPVVKGRFSTTDLKVLQISYTSEVVAVTTGSNVMANLLDMLAVVTLSRMKMEHEGLPHVFGESVKPLLNVLREGETVVWQIAPSALQPDQIRELRNAIEEWYRQNPDARIIRAVRAVGFTSELAKIRDERRDRSSSVFDLLGIDPLAGLDPATRELAQTRLFAERALFLGRQMPQVLRWQTELLALNAAKMPEVETLLANTAQIASSADRFSLTIEQLPQHIGEERRQLLAGLETQSRGLTALAAEAKQAFAAAAAMSDSANATLKTFQDVVAQLDTGPPEPSSEPFRIRDYTAAAAEINDAAQRLLDLLKGIDQTMDSPVLDQLANRVDQLSRKTQARGEALVDYAFQTLLRLILVACVAVLVTVLTYRALVSFRTGGRQPQ